MGHISTLKKAALAVAKDRKVIIPSGFEVDSEHLGDPARALLRRIASSEAPPTLREKVIAVARKELGVKEHPANSNDGPRVHEYQATTGAYKQPWCASFAKWVYIHAGASNLGRATADCTTWLGYPHVSPSAVKEGDAVLFDWDGGDVDHIGLFVRWVLNGKTFNTIEGNTSAGSNANGGEVQARQRNIGEVTAFIRVL